MANEQIGERIRVDTDGRKYTFIMREDGSTHALRNGKPWLENIGSLAGGGLIFSLASDLDEARTEIARLRGVA